MFIRRFLLLLAAATLITALMAPLAAAMLYTMRLRFPLPRILDRLLLLSLAAALVYDARRLNLMGLLRAGFVVRTPGNRLRAGAAAAACGFALAIGAIALLWGLALIVAETGATITAARVPAKMPGYIISAVTIAVIEETFFRAFLLGGIRSDSGPRVALVLSALIYALAHLLRAPSHFYLTSYEPMAGFTTLGLSLGQLAHPVQAMPALIGLFLLGLLLGEIFLASGTVYFSTGLHAGLVLGAKSWRVASPATASLPRWLAGYSSPALISGPAAWVVTVALLVLARHLARERSAPVS